MRQSISILALLFLGLAGSRYAVADTCGIAGNLVTNCGFESGDFTGWSGSFVTLAASNPGQAGVDSSPFPVYNGTYAAYLGSDGVTSTLSQTFATVAGTSYTIQFALDNEGPADLVHSYLNSFSAAFGGATLLSEINAAASPFSLYTYAAMATGSSTTLLFTSRNDDFVFDLDLVSVAAAGGNSPVPEPSSLVLLGTGVLGMATAARRRLQG